MSRLPQVPPAAADAGAELDEECARRLCLLRACESGPPDAALWSPEDAAWASRLANESQGGAASPAAWLAERAHHAILRLLPRRASLARAYERRSWSARWVWRALLAGLGLGLLADMVGHSQHINLLAAPVWAVVGWNLLVYGWITWQALRAKAPAAAIGPLRRAVQRAFGALGSGADADAASTPEQRFVTLWGRASAPLAESRAALLLHVASAALALGLVAGLYARALVLDYRVSWQSTLLEPAQVHAWLAALLAPASALTGIAVPGVDAVAALRIGAAGVSVQAAPAAAPAAGAAAAAAPWLHLLAATLAGAVIVPRLLLALRSAWAAGRRARRVGLPLADAYTQKLLQGRRSGLHGAAGVLGVLGVQVLPHGFVPTPASTLALQALLASHWGPGLPLHIAASTAYGDEDRAPPTAPAGSAWRIAWFDLAATPEPQAQGRFIAQLRAASALPLVLLVDEAAYRQRLGAGAPRLSERRAAWQSFADGAGVGLACIDLAAAAATDPAAAAATLDAALQAHTAAVR